MSLLTEGDSELQQFGPGKTDKPVIYRMDFIPYMLDANDDGICFYDGVTGRPTGIDDISKVTVVQLPISIGRGFIENLQKRAGQL